MSLGKCAPFSTRLNATMAAKVRKNHAARGKTKLNTQAMVNADWECPDGKELNDHSGLKGEKP